jgi:transposase
MTKQNRGENKTVLAALTIEGLGPVMRFDGPMTAARFEGYIQHVLAPTLKAGQIVVADNLSAHHSDRARAAIEARGAHSWHLPPYSPDFNPIEEAFSKVKQFLRRAKARTEDALRAATRAAFATIADDDIRGWATHAGYLSTPQAS